MLPSVLLRSKVLLSPSIGSVEGLSTFVGCHESNQGSLLNFGGQNVNVSMRLSMLLSIKVSALGEGQLAVVS
jgi:hypothetical protein